MSTTEKGRLISIMLKAVVVVTMALLYVCFYIKVGWGIPCIFNLATNLECPGCGATRMLVLLCRGDVREAFLSNPLLLIMSPFFLLYGIKYIVSYVKMGKCDVKQSDYVILVTLIIVFLVYAVLRNIY